MGAKDRWERNQKAIEEGILAYHDGVPLDQCPYKHSDWGLGGWWDMGWREAKDKALETVKPTLKNAESE